MRELKLQHVEEGSVVVCASTGTAAVPHNGATLHAFAGVGLTSPTRLFAEIVCIS